MVGLRKQVLSPMKIADFADLLDRLGEDMSSWPVPQQQAAADLLRSSAEARSALAEARLLRQALSAPPIRAEAGLTERIMQGVRQGGAEPVETEPDASQPEPTKPETPPAAPSSDSGSEQASDVLKTAAECVRQFIF
ncbi:MAG: hypothetical protein HXX15_14235 [Rhodopseudomonas sp.]|uniref:hypothetical protein n=1 Tax=Rhodopseudomonas sp. TaxID=1078 RepID=UPI0017C7880C|nr:hypothetical protein [Rhodopseudomonas sp.]NVN87234.1 hypothetical protein [Rhodopseudomonas sp.]